MSERGRGDRVLAGLATPVGQVDEHRHVLTGRDLRQRPAVGRLQDERGHVRGLLDPADQPVRPQRMGRVDLRLLVQPSFLGYELGCEEPVHLVPRRRDFGGHGVTEHLPNRGQEVAADYRVLLGPDSQRRVLVGDPAQDVREGRCPRIDQLDGVGDHRRRQRPALLAGGLIALVEHPQELRVLGEHAGVEHRGDLLGMLADDLGGRRDYLL
jgi:hypothetical protein